MLTTNIFFFLTLFVALFCIGVIIDALIFLGKSIYKFLR